MKLVALGGGAGWSLVFTGSGCRRGGAYCNLGDCFIMYFAALYGYPTVGAAVIGAGLADLLVGYAIFLPATVIIKGLMAFLTAFLISRRTGPLYRIMVAILCECVMVGGYYLYQAILFRSFVSLLASVPADVLQGVVGILGYLALFRIQNRFDKRKSVR